MENPVEHAQVEQQDIHSNTTPAVESTLLGRGHRKKETYVRLREYVTHTAQFVTSKLSTLDSLTADVDTLKAQSHQGENGHGSRDKDKAHQSNDEEQDILGGLETLLGVITPRWCFLNSKQVGTVQDYRKEFAKRAARVKNWPEHCLLGVFLSGLKDELVADVRIQKPRTVYKALSLALEYEAKIGPTKPNKEIHFNAPRRIPNFSSCPNKFQTQLASGFGNTMQSNSSSNITPTAVMKPWAAEPQAQCDKGPCTRCGDRFFPGHRSKASLSLLEIGDGDGTEEDNNSGSADPSVEEVENVADLAGISLHAILGKYQGTTMKIKADGVGAVLTQQGHPIAYFNEGVSFSSRIKSTYDRELMSLVLALQKWKRYLLGRPFKVQTNHHSLKYLLEQRVTTHEQQRLLTKLLPFDFSIEYRAGKENKGTDALSSKPQHADFLSLAIPFPLDFASLQNDLSKDDFTAHIIRELQQNLTAYPKFQLVQARGISDSATPPPLPISESWKLLEPEKILKQHWGKESSVKVLDLLVQWKGRPIEEASWENYGQLPTQFPHFLIEDKSVFQGGSSDRPLITYSRRPRQLQPKCQNNCFDLINVLLTF
ncbi:retrotransposon gag domain, Retroviral aspartyl protease [Senna tora]|uniref:Retrotransposon gag domain, Retroviral aspartyl protease n=1 Tax=Senna tora TaxID=362788 RepID=A0A834SX62_9FABA|nr:retrotransposon gag domain, Retroviral aspartyl protease [Senna tora]